MKSTAGFTLIEVMFGIFVFTVGILGVISMQTTSIAANAKAQHTSEGSALASSMIAKLRPLDYNDELGLPNNDQQGSIIDLEVDENAPYEVEYDVRRLDSSQQDANNPLGGEVALITMNVTWQDYGTQRSTTFYYFKQDELK